MSEIAKTYDPASFESGIYRMWKDEGCFTADPAASGEPYCIVMPPPNVTGVLHLGHAINNTLQDILIRVHRMRGFNTLWVPGLDHAGIATQAVVEKQLKEKENKTRNDLGREELVKRIWEWKEQYGNRILEQLARLGCSCDWTRTRFTLDEMCARAVRETFFKLFKDGLIYRGKRLVNWDVQLQTSISDDEIYHETVKTSLWHIRYPIVSSPSVAAATEDRGEGGASEVGDCSRDEQSPLTPTLSPVGERGKTQNRPAFMIVATTRPETMLGDTAVAVHSEDPRWNWAIGSFVELPLTGRKIPIIADDILVDPKFGSGVVKVTPAHDPNDYAVWERHKKQHDRIEILNILNSDGTINENGGKYKGMKRDAARKAVVEDLTVIGLLEKEEPYETEVGHSDRSKTPIEPYLSDQWFVRMAPLAEPALEVVRQGVIKFFPERHAQQYLSWLGEKRDWPISRQLWWGHRIPVWRKKDSAPDLRSAVLKAAMKKEENAAEVEIHRGLHNEPGIAWHPEWSAVFSPGSSIAGGAMYCVSPDRPDLEKRLEALGYVQDSDVLDTWFSSALWPHSTLGWPLASEDLARWYPGNVLQTGRDIITLWVARMVIMGMYNMGGRTAPGPDLAAQHIENLASLPPDERAEQLGIPFRHVAINPTILDGKGERMSKSKGNGVDPVDVIDTHGADALRFTLTHMATETQDVRMPVKKDSAGRNTSDKFDLGSRFCNKIWQVANFLVIANLEKTAPEPVDEGKWSLADRWIVARFNRAVRDADAALAVYRFDQYAKLCYDFFYGDFCDWYAEIAKPALKDPVTAGQTANILAAVLDGAMRLMHPMIPFVTETIWTRLNDARPVRGLPGRLECPAAKRLIKAEWPAAQTPDEGADQFSRIQEIITQIRRLRTEFNVDERKRVDVVIITPTETVQKQIDGNRLVIEALAACRVTNIALHGHQEAPGSSRAAAADCVINVEGLIDPEVEQQRIAKRCEELTRMIAARQARLANPSYALKAPPNLVQQTRDELAEAEAELAKLIGNV